ncbi:hypothetical protein FXW30_05245 [Candidatus Liberibacter asiaticus]|nr:hypothetical protein FXW22_05215 [Candidatus Liberibacter asiaticus]KAE9511560.1 hypothetical protein FXW31_00835 [Candidatus Liberibacter asiaticus]KAE9511795.1 hypothetical protein FXW32_05240 [Candidatus Liberibacter asiaticus]KAE9512897.1 hypothetical protein FXW35_05290 [Candidatus Liberibacter asiaticus]KAE9513928.1 hypothetical protein FXW25_05185 [Candidatus Liberibacter asiaticus]
MVKKAKKAVRAKKGCIYYSPELFAGILDQVANGKALGHVLRKVGMPKYSTFYRWIKKDLKLQEAYTEALQCRLDLLAEELLEEPAPTAEELANPVFYSKMRDRKQRMGTFLLEKLSNQKYGPRVSVESKHTIDLRPAIERLREHYKHLKPIDSERIPHKSTEKPLEIVESSIAEQSIIEHNN